MVRSNLSFALGPSMYLDFFMLECNPMPSENSIEDKHSRQHASQESKEQSDKAVPQILTTPTQPQSIPAKHHCEIACNTKRDWIDKGTLALEGFGLFVLIIYTVFTGMMYFVNKNAADAAKSAATTADATLKEIQKGGTDTHDLAVAAGEQAKAMTQQLKLQTSIATQDRGKARLTVKSIFMTYSDAERKIQAGIIVQNNGKTTHAEQIGCAAKVAIRSSAPKVDPDEFKDFSPVQYPNIPLPPVTQDPQKNFAQCWERFPVLTLTPEEYSRYKTTKAGEIYIWGVFRHTDLGVVVSDTFCKRVSVKEVFSAPEGINEHAGRTFETLPSCH